MIKKMIKKIHILFIFSLFSFSVPAFAAMSPLSVNLIPPVQFPPDDFDVTGLRVSPGWGRHRSVYGLDVGLLGNITDQTFTGVAISGGFNYTKGTTTAIGTQLAGLANINTSKARIFGLQAALGLNMNSGESTLVGVGVALANITPFTNVYGVQMGLYNKAKDVYGLQIGIVNYATNLHGIQIGLLNFNAQGLFSVAPIINVGF